MKQWLNDHPRSAVICALTLLLPCYLVAHLLAVLWQAHSEYQSEIDYLEPRIARLEGLLAQGDLVRAAHARATSEVGDLVYPVSEDRASASANLQSVVRQIFSGAGMSVSNSQVLPPRQQGAFDHLGLKLSVSGGLEALDASLQALADHEPLLLVTSIDIQPGRPSRATPDEQTVSASVQVLSLRAGQ